MRGSVEPTLVPCHECGALINRLSKTCVKCNTRFPVARCRLCWKPVRCSEMVISEIEKDNGPMNGPGSESPGYHRECILSLLPNLKEIMQATCPDCGTRHTFLAPQTDLLRMRSTKTFRSLPQTCNGCGKPNPFANYGMHGREGYLETVWCCTCFLAVFPDFEPTIPWPGTDKLQHAFCAKEPKTGDKKPWWRIW